MTHVLREMMFGTRDQFEYFECRDCGSIQRLTEVADEGKYYPSEYYSFSKKQTSFRSRISGLRDAHVLRKKTLLGFVLNKLWPLREMESLSHFDLDTKTRILDVGCGSGALLQRLARAGFQNLTGADPFVQSSTNVDGVKILKSDISDIEGNYDLIMFHHSFEHIMYPAETLSAVRRLLSKSGRCLIRIPTCSSFAWKHYGKNWVQLDPPRHIVIFSRVGFSRLAERLGFRVDETIDDSSEFQFWASEMYSRNIALRSKSFEQIFSTKQIDEFRERATELNSKGLGDQTAFIISSF
jgi:SAM-dependent methyltransferase